MQPLREPVDEALGHAPARGGVLRPRDLHGRGGGDLLGGLPVERKALLVRLTAQILPGLRGDGLGALPVGLGARAVDLLGARAGLPEDLAALALAPGLFLPDAVEELIRVFEGCRRLLQIPAHFFPVSTDALYDELAADEIQSARKDRKVDERVENVPAAHIRSSLLPSILPVSFSPRRPGPGR